MSNPEQEKENLSAKDSIVIPDNRIKHVLLIENILRLESKRVYTIVFTKNNKQFVCSRHLKHMIGELHSDLFFRVHKSHVINLSEVKGYRKGRGGQVVMSDDSVIAVSQRKKKAFLKIYRELNKTEIKTPSDTRQVG
jgi:two-component system LytT family response regulator